MKIAHFSDTHGMPLRSVPNDVDLVIHSGDMLPDLAPHPREEAEKQEEWVRATIQAWTYWLGDKPMVFCPGNHDFFDPVPLFRQAGMNVKDVREMPKIGGILFAGLPNVPPLGGWFNFETEESETEGELEALLVYKPDVLVCHCPPLGVLDCVRGRQFYSHTEPDRHIGCRPYQSAINRGGLKAFFCGHCHQDHGTVTVNGCLVSNAATTMNVVEL